MTAAWKYSLSPISYIQDIQDPFFLGCVISLIYRTVNLKTKLENAKKNILHKWPSKNLLSIFMSEFFFFIGKET